MALTEIDGGPGAPWEPPLAGALDRITVRSRALADNPLGDPAQRPLYVYRPPGVARDDDRSLPAVYVIQGYTGQLDDWIARSSFEPTFPERLDAMFAAGDCPPALVVMVDAWTRLGGSQFLNSSATGNYLDYLCDEIVPFVDATYATDPERRAITGKSSGGYGAMVVPMLRPGLFQALGSTSGDALFECCYGSLFAEAARALRDRFDGSWAVFFERLAARDHFDYGSFGAPLEAYGYAAAYSPDPDHPEVPALPFDSRTGRMVPEVWERWLARDPVRMIAGHADALRAMRGVYLEAGRADEYFLDLGAQAVSAELHGIGVAHTLELFDGRHGGIRHRYPATVRWLVEALA